MADVSYFKINERRKANITRVTKMEYKKSS